jgi:hypothetical protein
LDNNQVGLESVIFFETPQEIFARVFSELKPRTARPAVRVEFRKFANANSFIQWDEAGLNEVSQVSVKFKTAEKTGPVGEGRSAEAQALVTICRQP